MKLPGLVGPWCLPICLEILVCLFWFSGLHIFMVSLVVSLIASLVVTLVVSFNPRNDLTAHTQLILLAFGKLVLAKLSL